MISTPYSSKKLSVSKARLFGWVTALVCLLSASPLLAQRGLRDIPDPDPEIERQSFIVADGFEVNLFAADPMLAKPIQMNFDAQGRLWVASSEVYPHIKPGQQASDKILILEDRDLDGVADKTTVFADGLLIPTGIVPGDGGAYVVNSTELIHLADTDEDGKADRRRIVLSGFGAEDTHHLLHTLRWGHDGMLYMNQSIYIHSHIETPYGVRHLNAGGIWQFRPETMQLEVFCRGFVNSWGHHFDRWGQSFATDGAGGEGIHYVFPGAVYLTAYNARKRIKGLNPGSPKHCGLEVVSGRHLPPEWQGNLITNDFRAHRVCRFVISEDGAGYASRQETELIKTTHGAFRPIDVKMGPDGAIYIADWYNPIIQHGEVDFRDPRRDHVHGRIWRITAKGRPTLKPVPLVNASISELLEQLEAPEEWVRLHAKLILKSRDRGQVLQTLSKWRGGLDSTHSDYEHHRLEALWLRQSLRSMDKTLLRELLKSSDHRVRAAAVRVLSQMSDLVRETPELLAAAIVDQHPQVRLEAVRALATVQPPQAAAMALKVLDQPMDRFLEFALWQAMRDLESHWLPGVQDGSEEFDNNIERLTFALKALDAADVGAPLLAQLEKGDLSLERKESLLSLMTTLGGPNELAVVLDHILVKPRLPENRPAELLHRLVDASQRRNMRPAGDLTRIAALFDGESLGIRVAAIRAAGIWRIESLHDRIATVATSDDKGSSGPMRHAAFDALARFGGEKSRDTLKLVLTQNLVPGDRTRTITALLQIDIPMAVEATVVMLEKSGSTDKTLDPTELIAEVAARPEAAKLLAEHLAKVRLNADVAKLSVRAALAAPKVPLELVAALRTAGKLDESRWVWSPQLVTQLVAEMQATSDPHHGEAIYRREQLQCIKCHAIGGAGGKIGPDLASVGASAPPDYVIESLIAPNRKIKENYHSKIFLLSSGKVVSGIPIRQTTETIVIRNADGRKVEVPKDEIDETEEGRSLMPEGLVDGLTRPELLDLARFLSELGKVGEFALGKQQYVRQWESLVWTQEAQRRLYRTSDDTAAASDSALNWRPAYSRVSGELPLDRLGQFTGRGRETPTSFVRFEIDVTTPGKIAFHFNSQDGLRCWFGGNPVPMKEEVVLNATRGRHILTVAIDQQDRSLPLRVELQVVGGSSAQAQLVSGE